MYTVILAGMLMCLLVDIVFNHSPGALTERTVRFRSCTLKGAHSYKQELPNNCFVNALITVCSSTARGSPWVEQAGPMGWKEWGREAWSFLVNRVKTGLQVWATTSRTGRYCQVFMYLCVFVCMRFLCSFHLRYNKPPTLHPEAH